MRKLIVILAFTLLGSTSYAGMLLIPMDESQQNHIKSYGIAYWVLEQKLPIEWLLNYRGGSFLMDNIPSIQKKCTERGVSFQVIADAQVDAIYREIADPEVNMEKVKLEVAPKIAVYTPLGKQPWDDAVTLVLTYAEIPYTSIYDEEIITGKLPEYDWLHLHHEDFTGQYGKFYGAYNMAPWYRD